MGDAVEKIGIAESDVLCSGGDLLANVGENIFDGDNAKLASVYGNNGTMAAEVFAAARCLGVADGAVFSIGHDNMSVGAQRGQIGAVGNFEGQARDFCIERAGSV